MKIERVENKEIPLHNLVSFKQMGHIYEVVSTAKRNTKISIKKIDSDHYCYLPTGEILECNHISNRSESMAQVAQSLGRLRDIINTNVVDVRKCKWITLTYHENMTDTKKLYIDFKSFIRKFNRKDLKEKYKYQNIEYIVAMEPQGRGAWHAHLILIFDNKAPFIKNEDLAELWGHGFTTTKKLDDIDNVGAYLTAYLGDMELDTTKYSKNALNGLKIKNIEYLDDKGNKQEKKYIKGGRLHMYPPKFNLYRCSKGIKYPKKEYIPYQMAQKKIGQARPIYKKTIQLTDLENNFENQIIYEYYNTQRNINQ